MPAETFTFPLEEGEEHTLLFWPEKNASGMRGMFYIHAGGEDIDDDE